MTRPQEFPAGLFVPYVPRSCETFENIDYELCESAGHQSAVMLRIQQLFDFDLAMIEVSGWLNDAHKQDGYLVSIYGEEGEGVILSVQVLGPIQGFVSVRARKGRDIREANRDKTLARLQEWWLSRLNLPHGYPCAVEVSVSDSNQFEFSAVPVW